MLVTNIKTFILLNKRFTIIAGFILGAALVGATLWLVIRASHQSDTPSAGSSQDATNPEGSSVSEMTNPTSKEGAQPNPENPAANPNNPATPQAQNGGSSGSGGVSNTGGNSGSTPPPATDPPASPPPSSPQTPGLTNAGIITDYTGSYTISSGTHVIENKRFTDRLTVNGGNVTIRNSTFNFQDYYHILGNGGSITVEHSEFDGQNTTSTADDLGITGDNITVRYSTFKRLVNAMRPGSNSLIEYNAISQPNTAYGPAHSDGIEVYGGSNITIRSNNINISGGSGETGCVNIATDFGNISNVLVEGNDFTGGTYSFYARLQGAGSSITQIRVRNNRWHTPHIFGTHSVDPTSSVVEWTGNTLNGATLNF